MITVNVWLGVPFMMVAVLGGLQSIPGELYEAAEIDGATPWQRFRYITVPGLRTVSSTVILLGTIWTFNMFPVIFLISGGRPGQLHGDPGDLRLPRGLHGHPQLLGLRRLGRDHPRAPRRASPWSTAARCAGRGRSGDSVRHQRGPTGPAVRQAGPSSRGSQRRQVDRAARRPLLGAVAVSLFPIVWLVLTSLKPRDGWLSSELEFFNQPSLDNYTRVLTETQFPTGCSTR